jgi:hypothetical protein
MGHHAAPEELAVLTTLWRERGVTVDRLDQAGSQSLDASDRALTSGLTGDTGDLRLDDATRAALVLEPLVIGRELGRGGMGIVNAAEQQSVRREVAVKRLAEHADDRALASLLKEAWVAGLLAHPNIAPVHVLASLDGRPAVVMKRIEGASWREALRDATHLPEGDREDPLAFHLRVLVAVANAIHYAHRRGVLHLDLKPENVMLGAFGEVSVLDWGLAAGFGEAAPQWLPRASEVRAVAGTPDYMPHEVAIGAGDRFSPRTDVYLLGAALHEVLTGKPPHHGGSAMQRLFRAFRSDPPAYAADVPPGLAAIATRAMSREAADRFESAEAFRDAIESFLVHRRGDAAVELAVERAARLDAAIVEKEGEVEIVRLFGGARFALREAETARPGHAQLPAIRARLYGAMAAWAMDAGRLALAARHLGELSPAPAELAARLARLEAAAVARSERVERLEDLARDQDLDDGTAFRRRVLVGFSFALLVGNVVCGWAERAGLTSLTYPQLVAHGVVIGACVAAYALYARARLFRNRANTVLFTLAILTFFGIQGFWVTAWLLGIPFRTGLPLSAIFYVLVSGAVATLLSLRFALSPIFAAAGLLFAAAFPALAWEAIGVSSAAALATVGLAWRTEAPA